MDDRTIAMTANYVKAAQNCGAQMEPPTSTYSAFDLRTGYEVAGKVHQTRRSNGARPGGRKIGLANSEMWRLFGVREPVWGYVYDHSIIHCPDGTLDIRLGGLQQPRIEAEIVIRFLDSPSAEQKVPDDVLESIDWIAHGIGFVQCPDWRFKASDVVADNSLHDH